MKVTGTGVVAICLATMASLWLILYLRENIFFEDPPAPPDSPVGTFEFTIVGDWIRGGPPEQGTNGAQEADWSIALVVRPDGTFRYTWQSLRQAASRSGSLEGTWHAANQGIGPSSRHWHLRIPGRPEPSRVRSGIGGQVTDEISWYRDSGWWISAVNLHTGALDSAFWPHRRAPKR